ncbi:hypothetical protein H0H93_003261 [Arthromyces matolae]|nr:hypothetical protein H0H93_003261 [Arthromyces matolae]
MATPYSSSSSPLVPKFKPNWSLSANRRMSKFSSPRVPDSGWASENFMLGAGMVIIQPSTDKVVIVFDTEKKHWFLPRGRKDIGESLEVTALREAYEESGYEATFFPLLVDTRAPSPPSNPGARFRHNTEPIYTTLSFWPAGRGKRSVPGEYMTFWFVGQIPEDAVWTPGTGMPDEQTYRGYVVTWEDALDKLWGFEREVLRYAWETYTYTMAVQLDLERAEAVGADSHLEDQADDAQNGELDSSNMTTNPINEEMYSLLNGASNANTKSKGKTSSTRPRTHAKPASQSLDFDPQAPGPSSLGTSIRTSTTSAHSNSHHHPSFASKDAVPTHAGGGMNTSASGSRPSDLHFGAYVPFGANVCGFEKPWSSGIPAADKQH